MTECSTPPSEEVEWRVQWVLSQEKHVTWHYSSPPVTARTAWLAHQQIKGAPAFGSCRVVRVKGDSE